MTGQKGSNSGFRVLSSFDREQNDESTRNEQIVQYYTVEVCTCVRLNFFKTGNCLPSSALNF